MAGREERRWLVALTLCATTAAVAGALDGRLEIPLGVSRLQVSWTPAEAPGSGTTEVAHAILREGLATNGWVFEYLHRDNPAEVAEVRAVADEIVGDAPTDRLKVERLLRWLAEDWDFSVEHSVVNAAELLRRGQGQCETIAMLVGLLDTLDIQARYASDVGGGLGTALEVWLEGGWRTIDVLRQSLDDRSMFERAEGHEGDLCIVYVWRDPNNQNRLVRSKLWFTPQLRPIFTTNKGLRVLPDVTELRMSY